MNPAHHIIRASVIALIVSLAGLAQAESSDSARIKELENKLERSLELIDQLSLKISKIEQTNASARASQTQATKQEPGAITAMEHHGSEIGNTVTNSSTNAGLPLHGFVDVGLSRSGEDNVTKKGRKGAAVGTVDLYLAPQFSDHVKALIEGVFENDGSGNFDAEIERLQIGYSFSDAITVWGGRFHTPFGYWNTAYHHGAQLQTSILRPQFLEFEDKGGILPAHTVGGWLTGTMRTNSGKFGYDAYIGNAPKITDTAIGSPLAAASPTGFSAVVNLGTYAGSGTINPQQGASASHRSSLGFNAWFEPTAVNGLRLGLHGLRTEVLDDSANINRTLVKMLGGYFFLSKDRWEVISEYYLFRNQDRNGRTGPHRSWAGYTQLAYNIGDWTPFVRAERAKLDQTDNYFGVLTGGRSYQRVSGGLRYDVAPSAALKFEFLGTRKEDLGPGVTDSYSELLLQYAIRF